MFAGCLEKNSSEVGERLISQVTDDKGLLGMPYENLATLQKKLSNNYQLTLVEQSIFSDTSICIEQLQGENIFIVGWLRIDNVDEIRKKLSLQKKLGLSARQLIMHGYSKYGEVFFKELIGDFSLVVFDGDKQLCFLIRDHFGVRPLYFYFDSNKLIFASSVALINTIKQQKSGFSKEYLARFALFTAADWRLTPYENTYKVKPAHLNIIAFGGEIDQKAEQQLFEFNNDTVNMTLDECIVQYKKLFNQSIKYRLQGSEKIACEASGGLDSSSILATLKHLMPATESKLLSFGYVNYEQEEHYIRTCNEFLKIDSAMLLHSDRQKQQKHLFNCYGFPVDPQLTSYDHREIYQLSQQQGVKVLLSGFGGDEFCTNYGALARVELLQNWQMKKWFNLFAGNFVISKLRAVHWLIRFLLSRSQFEVARNLKTIGQRLAKFSMVKANLVDEFGIYQIIQDKYRYDSGFVSMNDFMLQNRLSPDLSERLEFCSLIAMSHGVEYRWPFLDARLVQFFLNVPSEYKFFRGQPRYLHRQAMLGLLPTELLWKGKSMGKLIGQQDNLSPKSNQQISNSVAEQFDYDALHPLVKEVIDQKSYNKNRAGLVHDADLNAKVELYELLFNLNKLSNWIVSVTEE